MDTRADKCPGDSGHGLQLFSIGLPSLLSHRKKPLTVQCLDPCLPSSEVWTLLLPPAPYWGTSLGQDSFLHLRGILRSMTMPPLTSSHLPKPSQRSVPSQFPLPVSYRRHSFCMATPESHIDCFTTSYWDLKVWPQGLVQAWQGRSGEACSPVRTAPSPQA